jgi:ATP-dependent Clp protease ATP-binding subunit ClpA
VRVHLDELLEATFGAAGRLGHDWIGPEHLVLGLVATDSAAQRALAACGISSDQFAGALADLPGNYHRRRLPVEAAHDVRLLTAEAREIIARAEGLAAGLANDAVLPEHVLLSIMWEPGSLIATNVLARFGVTPTRVLDELVRERVRVPAGTPPTRPAWGPFTAIAPEEFESVAAELDRAGVAFRYGSKGNRMLISVAERGTHRAS